MTAGTDPFREIRPYRDREIRPVLQRLLGDPEFLDCMLGLHHPRLSRVLGGRVLGPLMALLRPAAAARLRREARGVYDVASMQGVIAAYIARMMAATGAGLSASGMERLQPGRSHVFVCNHRDIALDPALINYLLHQGGRPTVQIAIGDNLLNRPFVSDLMRLNKSFIVRRSLRGRELLQSLGLLSAYIHHCIDGGESVWIAQREGRAKDGIDRTDPALLKMLGMGRRQRRLGMAQGATQEMAQEGTLKAALARLHIVPVAISYEFDACDVMKAEERYQIETAGNYRKTERSDLDAIVAGVTGYKGRVHVAFGRELQDEELGGGPEAIAAAIDRQIVGNYRLYGVNFAAAAMLLERGLLPEAVAEVMGPVLAQRGAEESQERMRQRLAPVPARLQPYVLFNYANPVLNRYNALSAGV